MLFIFVAMRRLVPNRRPSSSLDFAVVSQHKISKFPVIPTKVALEHNQVTLEIEPTRFCEVSSLDLRLSLSQVILPTF